MKNRNNIKEGDLEIRSFELPVELRADENSRTVTGYAAVFEKLSKPIYWFREKIDKKAFDQADTTDVVAVLNHDNNVIFARTEAKNLKLTIDKRGLKYEFEAPNTTAGNDLIENIRLGNITKSSFAFTVRKVAWEDFEDSENKEIDELRNILEIKKVYDVSPVIRPAYPDANVGLRSLDEFKAERDMARQKNEDETTKETEIEKQNKISRSKRERIIRIRQNEINL
jgi:uncharacterized protein